MSTVVIPETVILEMQKKAYEFQKEIERCWNDIENAVNQYHAIEKNRAYATLKFRETLDFLQQHNSNACHKGWFEEFGEKREDLLRLENMRKLPDLGPYLFQMDQPVRWEKMPKEQFKIVGIKRYEVMIEGDFSQVGQGIQSQWVPIEEVRPI